MAIKPMVKKPASSDIEIAPGVSIVGSDDFGPTALSFPNLATAIEALVGTIRSDEAAKVKMARIIDAIERQELYREAGVDTMKAFFPMLLAQTEAIGWKSATSIKRYLAWFRLYILELGLDSKEAIRAVSHLHNLKVLADVKNGELVADTEKDGKLGAAEFEAVVRFVTRMVTGPTKEQQTSGLDEVATAALTIDYPEGRDAYVKIVGRVPVLPAGGWSLADTQEIIDCLRAAEEDETTAKVERIWRCERTANNLAFVVSLDFVVGETIVESFPIEKAYSQDELKRLSKGDTVVFDGEEGEE